MNELMNELVNGLMNGPIDLALSIGLGFALGVFYFGGLWLTIQHLPHSKQPSLLALGSFLGRSAVCLFGFYMAVGSGFEWLILSLAGFMLAKMALVRSVAKEAN